MTINKHTTAFLAQPAAIEELDEEEKKRRVCNKERRKKKRLRKTALHMNNVL